MSNSTIFVVDFLPFISSKMRFRFEINRKLKNLLILNFFHLKIHLIEFVWEPKKDLQNHTKRKNKSSNLHNHKKLKNIFRHDA